MKKALIILCSLILIICLSAALFSRFLGIGIRVSDGSYLGYSEKTSEWLFLEYQNVPVRHDGPYVFNGGDNRYALDVIGDGINPAKMYQTEVTNNVTVLVDNALNTQFVVPIRNSYSRSLLNIPSPNKLLAASDFEGEFDAMVALLHANDVIDDQLNWSYGSGHLVLIGDMVDRGTNVVPLLWLIYKLEAEARLAGGDVHYILGNHERYLLDGRVKSVAKKYYGTFRTTKMYQHELWSENSELGRWLRSKPAVLKIGDTLFVHGGISPEVLSTSPTLQSIDEEVKSSFVLGDTIRRNIEGSVIHSSLGVLFYRGLSKNMSEYGLGEKASTDHVDQVLSAFRVKRIAIGHTLVDHIGYDYDGKVIRVDVAHSEGVSEALLIENNSMWRIDTSGNKQALERIN